MHNFPPPHPDELLYSTLARASVYHGITSPKQLLDAMGEFKHEVRQFQKPYDNQQAEQISLMV